jgi:TM2 domain-containing membrane protein YozV
MCAVPSSTHWAATGWLWVALRGSGCLWLALGGSGWLWVALAGSGWFWLALAGSGWLWLALAGSGWLWHSDTMILIQYVRGEIHMEKLSTYMEALHPPRVPKLQYFAWPYDIVL